MRFWSYDSPAMIFFRNLVDYILIGILWMVFCIPVFTCGAATTAALLTAEISIRKEEGRILATFWKWFRKEFKEATLLWLLWLPIQWLAVADVLLVAQSQLAPWVKVLIYVATGVLFCWSQLWFGYLSKFDDQIRTVLGNTFRMILGNVGRTLLIFIITVIHIVAVVLLLQWMPPFLLLLPGSYLLCYTFVIRKIFTRYLPEEEHDEGLEETHDET